MAPPLHQTDRRAWCLLLLPVLARAGSYALGLCATRGEEENGCAASSRKEGLDGSHDQVQGLWAVEAVGRGGGRLVQPVPPSGRAVTGPGLPARHSALTGTAVPPAGCARRSLGGRLACHGTPATAPAAHGPAVPHGQGNRRGRGVGQRARGWHRRSRPGGASLSARRGRVGKAKLVSCCGCHCGKKARWSCCDALEACSSGSHWG